MLIKINSEIQIKLDRISKKGNIKKDVMLEKILLGFISRYESKHGEIKVVVKKKKRTDVWSMYQIYKDYYFSIYGKEYVVDSKAKQLQDYKQVKDIQKKIIELVVNKEGVGVISVNEEDTVNAFRFLMEKLPDWYKKNAFHLATINRNFDKIINTIENGKQRGKNALDDFISSLSGNEYN